MPAPRTRRRARLALLATTALTTSGLALLAPSAAQANPAGTGLVISEVYGGGGNAGAQFNRDFVELYNPTASAIAVAGMTVQYRSSDGTTVTAANLTGSVPAGGNYLVGQGTVGTTGAALPTPDATSTALMSASSAVVLLVSNSAQVTTKGDFAEGAATRPANVVDTVGYGTAATTFETTNSAVNLSNTTSAQRSAAGADTDKNAPDLSESAPTPTNSTVAATPLSAANPGAQTATRGEAISPITLTASGGSTPYSWSQTGLPAGLSLSGNTISGTPSTAGSSSVTVTVTDSASPAATDSKTFTFTVNAPAAPTPIADIQGTGTTTPLSGQTVTTQGVVTAAYPTGGLNGFYLQTPGSDSTPNASDGIFVYGGNSGFSTYPAVGDSVRVSGTAGEFGGQTQVTATDSGLTTLGTSLGTAVAKTVIPGTDCVLPGTACLSDAAIDTAREKVESEAFAPADAFTATDVYDGGPALNVGANSSNNFGEIGLAAASSIALVAPTELFDTQNEAAAIAARTAYNRAHRIILDDGSTTNYTTAANTGLPIPWETRSYAPRVGAAVTFPSQVILGFGFSNWLIQPTSQVVGVPSATQPQFEQTRAANATPQQVGGDVKLATFNVLNFFPTTGEEYVGTGLGACTYYSDRAGNRITTNSCGSPSTSSGNGPRGAANDINLTRQRDKIVAAINGSGADIVSLEELENSVKFDKDRDFAISALTDALNSAAGAGTWAFVPSPAPAELPAVADQDVIRTGFVYKPANVVRVGASRVLADQSTGTDTFANAREPLAQAFKQRGTPNAGAFAVVVNHFKSKGSGVNDGTGQGNANPDRIAQANSLVTFANQFQADRGLTKTFLVGDFNAYSMEDPIQVLTDAGYQNLDSTSNPDEESYNFDGQIGSLDHVLANGAAAGAVNGVDVWEINGNESVYYEYSRFNYNVTNLYSPDQFRSSDHNPEIVGINGVAKAATTTTATDQTVIQGATTSIPVSVTAADGSSIPTGSVTVTDAGGAVVGTGILGADGTVTVPVDTSAYAPGVYTLTATYSGDDDFATSADDVTITVKSATVALNLLNINDFHGRIDANTTKVATTIERLRAAGGEANTLFLSAGDNIGASLFASSIQKDEPTIDVLNALALKASAIGNHEFDQGADDLTGRVEPRADFSYLAANIYDKGTADPAFQQYDVFTVKGVRVGIIGAITQETPSLVSPDGVRDLDFGDPVDAVNRVAAQLSDGDPSNGEADVLVAEYHEGAGSSLPDDATCQQEIASNTVFGKIARQTAGTVDAIFTGHTHKTYTCNGPVPGQPGRTRPILETGEYGSNIGQIVLTLDATTGDVRSYTQGNVARSATEDLSFPRVAEVKRITDAALANAAQVGNQPVGTISADITTAYTGGTFGPNGYTGGSRDNRSAESALGDLVANALRDGVSDFASPDLGVTNPGGLRAELLFKGDTSSNPQNTDGVVTFAEANAVLPFNNTVAVVKLTGAQLKQVLEQQYQTDANGNVPSRPYLQLGLSDNVRITADATAPAGSRITSVFINDVPLVPGKTYTVSTLSFLAQGGDNFRAFTQGTSTDTGLLDAQLFRDYLAAATRSPDFARQQVFANALPNRIVEGRAYSFTLGPDLVSPVQPNTGETLNLTSLGSPANTSVIAKVGGQSIGSFPVSGGTAQIDLTVPEAPADDYVTFTAVPSGTTVTVPLTQLAVSTIAADDVSIDYGDPAPITVQVSGADGTPTGQVEIRDGSDLLATITLNNAGAGTLVLPAKSFDPGSYLLKAVYLGDDTYRSRQTTLTLEVAKVAATLTANKPAPAFGQARKVRVVVTAADGSTPTGTVTVSAADGTEIGSAPVDDDGVALVTLPGQSLPVGNNTVTVRYSGDRIVSAKTTTTTVIVSKGTSFTNARAVPGSPRVNRNAVRLDITVTGNKGVAATGRVRVTVSPGSVYTVDLGPDGKASVDLGIFTTTGDKQVTVDYLGSGNLNGSTRSVVITVRP